MQVVSRTGGLSGVAEKHVRVVQYMHDKRVVRCAVRVTDGFKVGVEIPDKSALSPVWFAMLIDR